METANFKTFNYQENGDVSFSILATKKTTATLDSGLYSIYTEYTHQGYTTYLSVLDNTENYNLEVPFYFKEKVDKVFEVFYNKTIKSKINILGYKHKIGMLLYGKQGTGKTSLLKSYFEDAYKNHDAIVFNFSKLEYFSKSWEFIINIRKIQDNPIVIFLDECEDLFNKHQYEDSVKKALDGFDSIDNCIVLMATNYIDKIPQTIKERPSRIKYSIEVEGIQDEEIISNFLRQSFEKLSMEVDFSKEVSKMKGWTMDELKQWILDRVMNIESEPKKSKRIGY